jgi:hypothetical protein
MSSKVALFGIVLVVSVALGAAIGQVFFTLFEKTVPAAYQTGLSMGAAHWACIAYGLGTGVLIFVWTSVALLISRAFRGRN